MINKITEIRIDKHFLSLIFAKHKTTSFDSYSSFNKYKLEMPLNNEQSSAGSLSG